MDILSRLKSVRKRFGGVTLNLSNLKSVVHHSRALGNVKSTQDELPGQHHPSNGFPSAFFTIRSFFSPSLWTQYPSLRLICGSMIVINFRLLASSFSIICSGWGKFRGSHVKYCLSSVYSMSNQMAS